MALPKPQPKVESQSPVPVSAPAAQGNGSGSGSMERKRVTTKAPAFIRATSAVKQRLILNIQGVEGSGKDHMALEYDRGPIYIHSFDQGLEGVVQKFQNKREIYWAEYELTIQPGEATDREVGEAANTVWEQFKANYRDSLSSTRTEGMVIVDTGTESWELLRLASFGKLTQVMPHHYAKPNAEYRDLVREGYDATNVVWLHKMVDIWENYTDSKGQEKGRKTGEKGFKGMNDMSFLVQGNVQTWMERRDSGGCDFHCTVMDKYRLNPDMIGMTLDNSFTQLLDLTFAGM